MSRDIMLLDEDVRIRAIGLLQDAAERGVRLIVTQTLRTIAEQDALYAQGRTAPGRIVTNARGGWSWHNWGRAFDVAIADFPGDPTPDNVYDGPWKVVGALGEHLGLEWGGRWPHHPDLPHFQLIPAGMTLSVLNERTPRA